MRTVDRQDDAISMNASANGAALKLDHMTGFAVSVLITRSSGTLAGTLKLQATASNPFTDNVTNTANPDAIWDDIAGSSVAVSTTSTATYSYNFDGSHFRGVRLVWTRSGGEGSYTADWFASGPQS